MIFVIKKSDFLYFGVFSFRSEVTVLTTEITKLFRLHFSPSFNTKSEQNISELVQCKQRYSQIIFWKALDKKFLCKALDMSPLSIEEKPVFHWIFNFKFISSYA